MSTIPKQFATGDRVYDALDPKCRTGTFGKYSCALEGRAIVKWDGKHDVQYTPVRNLRLVQVDPEPQKE